jgi:hypothetical protein
MGTLRTFQSRHIALLFKCTGASFISGSVNNGFFENHFRSIITAGIGILLFVIGSFIDEYIASHGGSPNESMLDTLFLSIVLSLGIGFFTGGLQHFPFPNAPIGGWVVPLGFVLTMGVLAWSFRDSLVLIKPITYYGIVATLIAVLLSFSVSSWFEMSGFSKKSAVETSVAKTASSDADFISDLANTRRKAQAVLDSSSDANTKALAKSVLALQ